MFPMGTNEELGAVVTVARIRELVSEGKGQLR